MTAPQISRTKRTRRLKKADWKVYVFFINQSYGRGAGVGRARGVGVTRGTCVAVGVAVAVAVAVAVGVGVGEAVGVGVGDGVVPACTSNDPTSMRPLRMRQKTGPRWS